MNLIFWHWWALGAILIGIEMMMPSTWLIAPAAAAALVGLIVLLVPGLPDAAEIILFGGLAAAGLIAWRRWLRTRPADPPARKLNNRAQAVIGRRAHLETALTGEGGEALRLDDTTWRARPADGKSLSAGTIVEIVGVEGSLLLVRPVG